MYILNINQSLSLHLCITPFCEEKRSHARKYHTIVKKRWIEKKPCDWSRQVIRLVIRLVTKGSAAHHGTHVRNRLTGSSDMRVEVMAAERV